MKSKFGAHSLLSRLGKDERGTVLVQFTIYIVAIMGMMGLAIDGGRFFLVNNSLQELADAAALAGAAQLDGAKDAITRADTAAQATATDNPPKWWDQGGSATITTTYYSQLDKDTTTTDPSVANYIEVTTASSKTVPSFLNAVSLVTKTAIANNSTTATATAQGNDFANCQPTQSFICNPYEASEPNPGNASNFAGNVPVGTMFALLNKFVGGAPGNWGLLNAPAGSNPHDQPPFWAQSSLNQCTTGDSQGTTRPGNVAKFAQPGMNVRFDSPIGSGDESVSAPIVIDGFNSGGGSGFNCNRFAPSEGGNGVPTTPPGFDPNNYSATCNSTTSSTFSCPLPRDPCIQTNTCTTSIQGNGAALTDLQAYWKNHHSGNLPSGATRYQIYQQEVPVSQGGLGTAPFTVASEKAEPSGLQCTSSTAGNLSRRIINVAIVDCSYWGITGRKSLPAATLIGQFFMTEPALADGSIYGEFIGVVQAGTASANGIIHRIVQLVR